MDFTLFALFNGGTDFGSAAALAISNSSTRNDRAQIGEFSQAVAQARGNSTVMAGGFSGGTAFDGSWHSVAFRRNATAFELFVDGTRVASTTATLDTGSTSNRTTLMHILTSRTTAYAKGSIQHAAIWNTALSDSEIVAIQTARTPGEQSRGRVRQGLSMVRSWRRDKTRIPIWTYQVRSPSSRFHHWTVHAPPCLTLTSSAAPTRPTSRSRSTRPAPWKWLFRWDGVRRKLAFLHSGATELRSNYFMHRRFDYSTLATGSTCNRTTLCTF